jgi:hypothetical protein
MSAFAIFISPLVFGLLVYRFEFILADTAIGAYPALGYVLEGCAGLYAVGRVPRLGVINVTAHQTSVFGHDFCSLL